MKLQLDDFNAKLRIEVIFNPTIWNVCLRQDSNDNVVRIINVATSKNRVANSTMFPLPNIHEHTWTYTDGKIHNQADYIRSQSKKKPNI